MVSKARDDLPEPESPVKTINLSLGIVMSIFLRLCSLAPFITISFCGILLPYSAEALPFCLLIGFQLLDLIAQKSGVLKFEHLGRLPHFGSKLSDRLFTVET